MHTVNYHSYIYHMLNHLASAAIQVAKMVKLNFHHSGGFLLILPRSAIWDSICTDMFLTTWKKSYKTYCVIIATIYFYIKHNNTYMITLWPAQIVSYMTIYWVFLRLIQPTHFILTFFIAAKIFASSVIQTVTL